MGYYTISFVGIVLLALLALYYYRSHIISYLPEQLKSRFSSSSYVPLPTSWQSQIESGYSSSNFDLSANFLDGDSRSGLDEMTLQEIRGIMEEMRIGFDEARLVRQKRYLARNGIDPSGMPLDKKAVTSLS